MLNQLKIALAQTESFHDVSDNLATATRLFPQAKAQGTDLLVFPEMFMARPRQGEPLAQIAETLDGPFVAEMAALAKRHALTVMFGMWEKSPGERTRAANVVVVLDTQGALLARYHKVHLFDALSVRESEIMLAGDQPPPLFTLKGMSLGTAICYDLRFPELFRYLAHGGAQLVLVPSAWYAGPLKEDHWLTLLRARAIENTIYVAGCNLCGPSFASRSAIFDPFGVQLTDAGETEKLIFAVIDDQRIDEVRSKLPALSHRKPSIFE